ncbi:hypothetical protein BFINE_15660 [Bacteroides finegoldii DSM 17565]|nr:hypothetical protein BFINE_15660 [Bacteroides finegoldii DSM 17565]
MNLTWIESVIFVRDYGKICKGYIVSVVDGYSSRVAGNVFTGKAVEQGKYAVTYSMSQHEQISEPEFPCSPVAELNNLQSYQTSVTRVQRVQLGEYFSTLKNLLQCCADYENSLSQHLGKIYNTTYYCQPSSEYYVFALRRIII